VLLCFEAHVDRDTLLLSCDKLDFLSFFRPEADLPRFLLPFMCVEFSDRHFPFPLSFFWLGPKRRDLRHTLRQIEKVVSQRMVGSCSDERVGLSAERTLANPNFRLRTIRSVNVIAVAEGIPQLLNHFTDRQSLRPALPVTNTYSGDMGVRVLVRWCFVDARNSLASHLYSSKEI
jgi:hypothetical protein